MCCYCHVLSTTKPSVFCFFFSIYLNTFFLFCTTFSAWNSCDQTGNYISEQTQAAPCRQVQPDSSTDPHPKALCLKPKPDVCQEIWGFFLSLVQSQLESEKKNPLTSPQGPCLILYSLWICVQGFFYYLPAFHWKWLADGNSII